MDNEETMHTRQYLTAVADSLDNTAGQLERQAKTLRLNALLVRLQLERPPLRVELSSELTPSTQTGMYWHKARSYTEFVRGGCNWLTPENGDCFLDEDNLNYIVMYSEGEWRRRPWIVG